MATDEIKCAMVTIGCCITIGFETNWHVGLGIFAIYGAHCMWDHKH